MRTLWQQLPWLWPMVSAWKRSVMQCIRFQAVEHRIEFVTEKNGVAYYNDSKGTNPDAAIKGIQAMNRPTMAHRRRLRQGFLTYEEWIRAFDGKVKGPGICWAPQRRRSQKRLQPVGLSRSILQNSLEEAVEVCAAHAGSGEAVLLSPACASWDMFPSYEVRGKQIQGICKISCNNVTLTGVMPWTGKKGQVGSRHS